MKILRHLLSALFSASAVARGSYVLSTNDGAELHEMEGGKVVMSRRRCQPAAS